MKLCHFQKNGARDYHVKQNKPDSERQMSHVFAYMQSVDRSKEKVKKDIT
jgi:hypothetical protein